MKNFLSNFGGANALSRDQMKNIVGGNVECHIVIVTCCDSKGWCAPCMAICGETTFDCGGMTPTSCTVSN